MRSAGRRVETVRGHRPLIAECARLVTGFTAAHSLTLALSVTGLLRLPGGPVEIAIALSIVLTALGLALGRNWSPDWRIAFGFGLVHGLGFAGLLTDLLQGRALVVPLIAFNLGLEMAQLLLVVAALPLMLWLDRRPVWRPRVAAGLSMALALLGSVWLVERL
jgi:HupE / UreJ protein